MKQKGPLVSVIIPTYYRNKLLHNCIEKVKNQDYKRIELIVVDDSGEAHAQPVVNQYKDIKYIPLHSNKGPNFARKKGITESEGKYIQLLDDDDRLKESKISQQVKLLESNPQAGVCYCAYKREGGRISRQETEARGNVLEPALKMELTCVTSTMLLRRSIAEIIVDLPEFPGSDDTFWKIEFARRTNFEYIDDVLVTKGVPKEHREDTMGAVRGTWLVLNQYEELYSDHDPAIRQAALAKAMRREAKFRLQNQIWSLRAIYLAFYTLYTDPNPGKMTVALPVFSIFGRIGYKSIKTISVVVNRNNGD